MAVDLLVVYTERLDECLAFCTGLGLAFTEERHGTGPLHHAAVLDDGCVLELYPAGGRTPTGRFRLGLTTGAGGTRPPGVPPRPPGRHPLTDPDGRTVVLTVRPPGG
jgi:hypothetical protein